MILSLAIISDSAYAHAQGLSRALSPFTDPLKFETVPESIQAFSGRLNISTAQVRHRFLNQELNAIECGSKLWLLRAHERRQTKKAEEVCIYRISKSPTTKPYEVCRKFVDVGETLFGHSKIMPQVPFVRDVFASEPAPASSDLSSS